MRTATELEKVFKRGGLLTKDESARLKTALLEKLSGKITRLASLGGDVADLQATHDSQVAEK